MMRICICGGGALGLVMASVLSSHDSCRVHLLTGHPEAWQKQIQCKDNEGKVYQGSLSLITDDAKVAVENSDFILLCLPGFLIEQTLQRIQPYITTQAVGSIVSSTGFFFRAHEIFNDKTALFGFQRVPYIARVTEYGHSAHLLGYKKQLYMAIENLPQTFVEQWSKWLETPIRPLSSYLEASLTNSNPLLHPSRLYGLWHDWHEGIMYPTQAKFYAEWDEYSAEQYIAMDAEFQALCKIVDVSIPSVLEYYESSDATSLAHKLRSIQAFQSIDAPMKKTEQGWMPDFQSRYFTEDFPYGLQLVKDLAVKNNLETPHIDRILSWGKRYL